MNKRTWRNVNGEACYEDLKRFSKTTDKDYYAFQGSFAAEHFAKLEEMFDGIPDARLAEIASAEKDGRCVVLPCKVGDTVWSIRNRYAYKSIVTKIEINKYTTVLFLDMDGYGNGIQFDVDFWGEKVHATRAEAEAALSKVKE